DLDLAWSRTPQPVGNRYHKAMPTPEPGSEVASRFEALEPQKARVIVRNNRSDSGALRNTQAGVLGFGQKPVFQNRAPLE
ncbi:MAG TPA: hypothetical protein PLF85_11510, partial [Turneriella sp.]|nr:hypothetical protein [Turneriella sp.]